MTHLLLVPNCISTHTPVLEACLIEPEKSGVDSPPFWVAHCNVCQSTTDIEIVTDMFQEASHTNQALFWKGFFQAMEASNG